MTTVTKMRLSKETRKILKHFSDISKSIWLQPGDILATRNQNGHVYGQAKIPEIFPHAEPVLIFDLQKFLSVLNMFENADLEFYDDYINITNGRSTVSYYYSEPMDQCPMAKTKAPNMPPIKGTFQLGDQDLTEIQKAASLIGVKDLHIIAGNGTIKMVLNNSQQSNAGEFELIVENNYSGPDYKGEISVDAVNLMPGSYTVDFTDTPITRFTHTNNNVVYYIAIAGD